MNPEAASSSTTDASSDPAVPRRKSKRPKYSRFSQQELPASKLILSPTWIISVLASVAVIFIPIGITCLFASAHVVEIMDRYDTDCIPSNDKIAFIQSSETNKSCVRTLTVPKKMKAPVYIYYQLDNFYQNHRRYAKSRSDTQLRLKSAEHATDLTCKPEGTTSKGSPIVPCGLIAWSLFNDTFKFSLRSQILEVSKKNLTWKGDQDRRFGKDVYPKNFQSEGLIGGARLNESIPLSEQVDLIIWMRSAVLPTFRKLYGKIEVDLQRNDKITVEIENNYNTYSFGGKKILVLSTASWLGGKNNFMGITYLTFGFLSLLFAGGFIFLYMRKPRAFGDPSFLSWNKVAAAAAPAAAESSTHLD
ncbi:ALA-interacting subunit 1-like isoform X1 [Asparagus officinalis]|uniref:ALA-interacting subunit 1-like isoform X1 n=1 Tax=Asparagus officinalis TaxID=4686 RepID=UPI00098DF25A|nr:ALA-interacting subunit 1-like isoform X1 [Asparagus officinalis]